MKNTALSQKHIDLGAKMVPFAGYNMPVQYEGVNAEHETVRNAVGVFDVSHMGEFVLRGPNALTLIQKFASNDASVLVDGKAQYSCMPNGKGGIVDDLIIYRVNSEEYFIVVNASNIEKDWNWISSLNDLGVEMENLSDQYSLLAIQGPKAAEAMQSLTRIDLSNMTYYTFQYGTFAGIENVMVSATGYTGSGGFEVYVKNEDANKLWDAVFTAGADFGIKPIGLAARDTLRLEMGFCLYGNDIDDTTSPIEAGLGWITKFTKDFTDSEFLAKQKEAGVTSKLVAFEMIDRGIPRHDYPILDAEGTVIGKVTSGTMSPSMKLAIGLGYVTVDHSKLESEIFIEIREKGVKAKVVKLPFYKA
ncbi:MAG: glycine cleavage system aminomethyltransferase GcvT [Crocinitomicaceae bacterium]|jgi:aminomethyltransferase|nr:glycine cleavage system aminomethyltransferase GcvT [Crocinitomicaceae bacterium]MDP4760518.1 glycine cleavage system aminomethyltransferase GcvT [Crocinitomicaceae bacterium]